MWTPQQLFHKHYLEINRYLRKCGHSADEAADLTQDVFMRLFGESRPSRDDNLRAFLYTVARNLSTDVYRRQQVARMVNISDDDYYEIPDPTPSPECIAADRQQLSILEKALDELPPRTRYAFELYRFADFTLAQIAAELGLSVSRAWVLVQRAHAHLQAAVSDDPLSKPCNKGRRVSKRLDPRSRSNLLPFDTDKKAHFDRYVPEPP